MSDRCASLRTIDYPLGRPGHDDENSLAADKARALAGEKTGGVDAAAAAAAAAIEEDGAEVITFGCSGTFWLKPFVEKGLLELGWDVPVLEGYSTAITQAKMRWTSASTLAHSCSRATGLPGSGTGRPSVAFQGLQSAIRG